MHLYVQEMPSFSLMMLPSLESITASVSPSAFFFKNRFRPGAYERYDYQEKLSLGCAHQVPRTSGAIQRRGTLLLSLLSVSAVAAASASVVFSNLLKDFSLTTCRPRLAGLSSQPLFTTGNSKAREQGVSTFSAISSDSKSLYRFCTAAKWGTSGASRVAAEWGNGNHVQEPANARLSP